MLVVSAVVWLLLIIGIATDPEDAWWAVFGGVVITIIPVLVGSYLVMRKRKERRKVWDNNMDLDQR